MSTTFQSCLFISVVRAAVGRNVVDEERWRDPSVRQRLQRWTGTNAIFPFWEFHDLLGTVLKMCWVDDSILFSYQEPVVQVLMR